MGEFNFNYWLRMEPMKYADRDPSTLSPKLLMKRQEMIDNKNGEFIATEKHDGYWAMFIRGEGEEIAIRSRNKGKNSGEYGDFTGKLPHMVQEMHLWPSGTVVLGEICWKEYGRNSSDITTILGCLDEKAVERQKEEKLHCYVFDMLCWQGENFVESGMGYYDRLKHVLLFMDKYSSDNFSATDAYFGPNYLDYSEKIVEKGGEGCVIYRCDYPYEPGKRSLAWKTLKLKASMPEMELLVEEALNPNKIYDGKELAGWPYWEIEEPVEIMLSNGDVIHETAVYLEKNPDDIMKQYGTPVTKPYFFGWKNGVRITHDGCNFTNVTSGLTDEEREWLASKEATELIKNHQLYARIKAMQEGQNGALRHPVFLGFKIMDKPERVEFDESI